MGKRKDTIESDGPRKGRTLLIADLRRIFWENYTPAPIATPTPNPDTDPDNAKNASPPRHGESDPDSDDSTPEWDPSSEGDSDEDVLLSNLVPFTIGNHVKVWYPTVERWYRGVVTDVCEAESMYEVHYPFDDKKLWHDLTWRVQLVKKKWLYWPSVRFHIFVVSSDFL